MMDNGKIARWLWSALLAMAALVLLVNLELGGGCQNRAGMSCQQQSDCNAGLLCNKPPGAGPMGYGICEPGLKGLGEICISSAECNLGLACSTELGQPSADGWHGVCVESPTPDGGAADLGKALDLATLPDLLVSDAGSDL
jgi:hypothetical protein